MYSPPRFDFPTPKVIGVASLLANFHYNTLATGAAPASATGPAANEAQYWPFVITQQRTFDRGWWFNGTTPDGTNNVSVGIYDEAGNRLATTGNVALSGASVIQQAAFSASVTLAPGRYYMAIEYTVGADANGCVGYAATLNHRWAGPYRQAVGANPLPSTATFATWTSQVVPVFGISASGFAI